MHAKFIAGLKCWNFGSCFIAPIFFCSFWRLLTPSSRQSSYSTVLSLSQASSSPLARSVLINHDPFKFLLHTPNMIIIIRWIIFLLFHFLHHHLARKSERSVRVDERKKSLFMTSSWSLIQLWTLLSPEKKTSLFSLSLTGHKHTPRYTYVQHFYRVYCEMKCN